MPVDHHPAAAVADVPLGHEVLVVGAELLAVGRARGACPRPRAPGSAHGECGVGHAARRVAQGSRCRCSGVACAAAPCTRSRVADAETLQPRIGAEAVQAEQKPPPHLAPVHLSRAAAVVNASVNPMRKSASLRMSSRLVIGHRRPTSVFKAVQVRRARVRLELRDDDRFLRPARIEAHMRVPR